MKKRWIGVFLAVLMLMTSLCLPASLGGIREAEASGESTANVYKWKQGDSKWSNIYNEIKWSKACAVVAIAVQIARTDLVRVDTSAKSFNTSTKEGFNPATFAKVAVSKNAVTSGASVTWGSINKAVPGFVKTTDKKYRSASTNFSYYPAKSKQNIVDAMSYYLSKGYYPIIEGPGSTFSTNGGRHYVAVISATSSDVRVIDPSDGKEKSLFSVKLGGNTWTYSNIEKCGNPSGYGCCVLYKVDSSYLLSTTSVNCTVTFDPNGGTVSPDNKQVTVGQPYGELPTPTHGDGTTMVGAVPYIVRYSFSGWYTEVEGGTEVTSSTNVTNTSDHTLYARWTKTNISPISGRYLEINATNFPDENFRNYIIQNLSVSGDASTGYYMTKNQVDLTESICCRQDNIASLKGVELFPCLKQLDCSGNKLTTIDISKNTKLTDLDCSANKLTSLDVSTNTLLDYLYCSSNNLTSLIISDPWDLDCSNNKLKTLDLSKSPSLKYLNCSYNELSEIITLGYTHEIQTIICSHNKLTNIDSLSGGPKVDYLDFSYNLLGWIVLHSDTIDTVTLIDDHNPYTTAKQLKVYFDGNGDGGACAESLPGDELSRTFFVFTGYTYGLHRPLPSASRDGYKFAGWYDAREGGNHITESTTVTKNEDHTLYAHWTPQGTSLKYSYNPNIAISRANDLLQSAQSSGAKSATYVSSVLRAGGLTNVKQSGAGDLIDFLNTSSNFGGVIGTVIPNPSGNQLHKGDVLAVVCSKGGNTTTYANGHSKGAGKYYGLTVLIVSDIISNTKVKCCTVSGTNYIYNQEYDLSTYEVSCSQCGNSNSAKLIAFVFNDAVKTGSSDYTGQCGDNLYWSFDASNGRLTITGSGDMDDYYGMDAQPWAAVSSQITSISLPNSLTYIGERAFAYTNISSIIIPESVAKINEAAFYHCAKLKSVNIQNDAVFILDGAFAECTGLTSFTIPSRATSICGGVFYNCTGLSSVNIPSTVASIYENAFAGCSSLSDVYYQGTAAQKAQISISEKGNDKLLNATWHYTVVPTPTDAPTSIEMKSLPITLTYTEGQAPATPVVAGGVVLARYSSGEQEVALTADMISGYDPNAGGKQTLTVTYLGKTTTFDITISHVPGDPVQENVIPATCMESGSYDEVVYCIFCHNELSRTSKTTGKIAHTPSENVSENEVAPTCDEEGSYDEIVYCTVCDTELSCDHKVIPALGHTPSELVKESEVAATCTTAGGYDEVTYCTRCGAELSRVHTTIPKLGHTPCEPVKENEVPPSCTENGGFDEVAYCSRCGAELSRVHKTVTKLPHAAGEPVKENEIPPSCTANGGFDEVTYCTGCGAELSRVHTTIPKLGHNPGEPVRENEMAATCTTDGGFDEVVYCTRCGVELSRIHKVDAKHHIPGEPVKENEVAATCTEDGGYEEVTYCTRCKAEVNRTYKTVAKLGHTPGEPVKENEVPATTETAGGYDEVTYCTRCGAELSRVHKTIDKLPIHVTFKTQPKSVTVKSGGKATFKVKVKEKNVTYQWYCRAPGAQEWTKIPGATKASYQVVASKANDGWQFRCGVTNETEAFSSTATLTVKIQPPAVKTQPKDLTAKSGKKVKFSVKASGKGLTYTWYSRPNAEAAWTPVAGQTKNSLSIVASKANDGSQYYCHIQNADGEVDSIVVTLTVTPQPPTIKTQPKDAKVKIGAKAKFKVKATGKNVTYQWYYRTSETGEWILIDGATKATYEVVAEETNLGWQFRCLAKNADGQAYSNPATLRMK